MARRIGKPSTRMNQTNCDMSVDGDDKDHVGFHAISSVLFLCDNACAGMDMASGNANKEVRGKQANRIVQREPSRFVNAGESAMSGVDMTEPPVEKTRSA